MSWCLLSSDIPGMSAIQRYWFHHLSSTKPKLNKGKLQEKRESELKAFEGQKGKVQLYITFCPMHVKSLQSCSTLCDPMDRSPPGSSVPGILQARTLEWAAVPSSSRSSQPRDQTHISCDFCIAGGFFTTESTNRTPDRLSCNLQPKWSQLLKCVQNFYSF